MNAVQTVARGGAYFAAQAADTLHGEHAKPGPGTFRKPLTQREREVIHLLAEGKSGRKVAESLGISFKKVETHRANILRKLDLHCVAQLSLYAIKNHIVET